MKDKQQLRESVITLAKDISAREHLDASSFRKWAEEKGLDPIEFWSMHAKCIERTTENFSYERLAEIITCGLSEEEEKVVVSGITLETPWCVCWKLAHWVVPNVACFSGDAVMFAIANTVIGATMFDYLRTESNLSSETLQRANDLQHISELTKKGEHARYDGLFRTITVSEKRRYGSD